MGVMSGLGFSILQVGVVSYLIANGGGIPVPSIHDSFGRQGEQARLNGTDELYVVAVREVGTPDGTLKQRISGKEYAAILGIEAHATCRVAGSGYALKCACTEGEHIAIVQWVSYRTRSTVGTDTETGNGMGEVVNPWCIEEAGTELYAKGIFYEGNPKYVVEMQVGTQQILHLQTVLAYKLCQQLPLVDPIEPRVNDGGLV